MRRPNRLAADRHSAREELDHCVAEDVVAVSRHHVRRAGHVDVLAVRAQLQEILSARFTEHIGEPPAHQQSGQRQISRTGFETFPAFVEVARQGTKAGVPVPSVFAIRAETHVLGQTIEILRAFAVRLIIADGLRHLLQRTESAGLLAHECLNLVDAFDLYPGGDIDHDQRSGIDMILTDGDQTGPASHGCADEHRAPVAERGDNTLEILDHDILPVESVGSPVRIPVTARVEGDGAITRGAQYFAGSLPRMAGLSAAVLQQHQRPARVAPRITRYSDPANTVPEMHRLGGSRKPGACAHCWFALNPQAPGPPRLPQPWHGAGISARADAAPVMVAKADNFLRNSVPLQSGHSGAGDEWRIRTSNSLAHAAHWYS